MVQPGFNGVMSLYEAMWFSNFGHSVELLLPFHEQEMLQKLLSKHDLRSLDDLDRVGGDFAIRAVMAGEPVLGNFDVVIYQSYDAADWRAFAESCRRSAKILTKNFPKFVSGRGYEHDPSVVNQFKAFDFIACALQDDINDLMTCQRFYDQHKHQVAYVGRGADDVLLHPARKIGRNPVIGIDVPVGDDFRAVDQYRKALTVLRKRGMHPTVLTLGREIPDLGATRVPFARFDRIYDLFFNEIWIYCVINYAYSPAHVSAPVQQSHPRGWGARAVFEVQNVEAQMSGAALFGHQSNVIQELFDPGASGFLYPEFDDPEDIADRIEHIADHYEAIRTRSRQWALAHFRWSDCIRRWEQGLLKLLN